MDEPESQTPAALGMPFDEKGASLAHRLTASFGMVLSRPEEAGRRIGARRTLAPAIAFYALAGLPLHWASRLLIFLRMPAAAMQDERVLKLFGQALQAPEQLRFAKIMEGIGVALTPLFSALLFLIGGSIIHASLWAMGGLKAQRGPEVTFRSLLYTTGATAWLLALAALFVFLPAGTPRTVGGVLEMGLTFGVLSFQGRVLAHAHGIEVWRGTLAVLLPFFLLICGCACCLAGLLGASGALPA